MSKNFKVIGVGSPLLDTIVHVEEAFLSKISGKKGGSELAESSEIAQLLAQLEQPCLEATGGSAANTIVGLAHLGLPVTFLGKLGNDSRGDFYRERFKQIGVDTSRLRHGNLPNGHCLSLVTPDSQRTMRSDLGASAHLSPEEISVDDFKTCTHAHIEGYLLFEESLIQRVLLCAKEAGCSISLDLASFEVVLAAQDKILELLNDYVDIVFANEDEARALTGLESDYEKMLSQISEKVDIAVIKVGEKGSLIHHQGESFAIDPISVDQSNDTTGAGDLWASGFLYGWLLGEGPQKCGHYGSLLGAEIIQIMGTTIPQDRWEMLRKSINAGGNKACS